jgi:hypothetical protein
MNSLDLFSVRALMQALQQIHSTLDLDVPPERLFSAITALVPGAVSTIDELDLTTHNFENKQVVPYPDFNPDLQAFAAYQHQHPSWDRIIGDRLESSVKISDFVAAAEWQRTDLYNRPGVGKASGR